MLELQKVIVQYGGFTAVEDITFEVPVGQFVAVVGPTGCGKTALDNVLLGPVLNPFIQVPNALPRLVFAPIFFLLFGLDENSKIALGFSLVFFIVFFNAYQGVREVDRNVSRLGYPDGLVQPSRSVEDVHQFVR